MQRLNLVDVVCCFGTATEQPLQASPHKSRRAHERTCASCVSYQCWEVGFQVAGLLAGEATDIRGNHKGRPNEKVRFGFWCLVSPTFGRMHGKCKKGIHRDGSAVCACRNGLSWFVLGSSNVRSRAARGCCNVFLRWLNIWQLVSSCFSINYVKITLSTNRGEIRSVAGTLVCCILVFGHCAFYFDAWCSVLFKSTALW